MLLIYDSLLNSLMLYFGFLWDLLKMLNKKEFL